MTSERQKRKKAAHRRNLNATAQLHWELVHQSRTAKFDRKKGKRTNHD